MIKEFKAQIEINASGMKEVPSDVRIQTNPQSEEAKPSSKVTPEEEGTELLRRMKTPNNLERPFPFQFSTTQELGGSGCCTTIWVLLAILIYSSFFPVMYFYGDEVMGVPAKDTLYSTYMYILLINGLAIFIGGYTIVGCIAYPYSNYTLQMQLKRQTNERFSVEFIKCTERVTRLI